MSRRGCPLLALCICLAAAGCGDADLRDETPKSSAGTPEAAAKAAVREFVAGLRDGRKEAVLRAIDVPYFNHHEFGVIEDRGELERRYDQVLGPWTRSGPLPRTLTGINRYRETRGAMSEGVRALLGRVLGEDDFIVMLGDGPDEERYALVRIRGDVAKVVGLTTR